MDRGWAQQDWGTCDRDCSRIPQNKNLRSYAAGWGIAAAAQARLSDPMSFRLDELTAGSRPRRPEDVRQRLIDIEEAGEEDVAICLHVAMAESIN